MSDFRIYTLDDVASILKIDRETVKNYIRKGLIKKIDKMGSTRVTHTELEKFISGDSND